MLRLLACAAGIATAVLLAADFSGRLNLSGWANSARAAAAQHGARSYATCGWIGVQVTPMTAAVADSLGMAGPYGAIFATPQPGSPAANAGIEAFDVVTLINGSPLEHAREFAPLISAMAPGSSVYLNTNRNGQLIMVTLTVGSIKCHSLAISGGSGSTNLAGGANSPQVDAAQHGRNGYATCGWIGLVFRPSG
jgi:S1-C subfamily serine protease